MHDFNLQPEVMGFGRPERLLKAETAPAPVAPTDQWKARGDGFEVNGLGQLRTAFALPATEGEIAASMRHADKAPVNSTFEGTWIGGWDINRDWTGAWVVFDGGADGGDQTSITPIPFKPNTALESLVADIGRVQRNMLFGDFDGMKAAMNALSSMPPLIANRPDAATVEAMRQARGIMDAQIVPRDNRMFWHEGMLHTDRCQCDGCTDHQSPGRFAPLPTDDPRPLAEIAAASSRKQTMGEALRDELRGMLVKLAAKDGAYVTRETLKEFSGGIGHLGAVPIFRLAELKARLQADLDNPF